MKPTGDAGVPDTWLKNIIGTARLAGAGSSLRARFVRGAVWSLIGGIIAQSLGLASAVLTARLLGKEGFGQLGMIQSTVGMFGVMAGFGLGLTATKYVAELRVVDPDRAGRIIGLSSAFAATSGALVAGALSLFAPLLASRTMNAPALAGELRLGALLLALNAISGAQVGALSGFEAFKTIAKANLARGLLSFPLAVAGVMLWHLPGAVIGMVLTSAIGCLINHFALRGQCRDAGVRIRYGGNMAEWRVLWQFSFPALLTSAVGVAGTWVAGALLVNQPQGYAEMGVFNAANHWRALLTFLPTTNAAAALPILASVLTGDKSTTDHPSVEAYHLLNAALIWGVAVPIMLLAPWIMSLYGPGFEDRSLVMIMLVGGVAIGMLGNPMGTIIQARGLMWIGLGCNSTWSVLLCVVSLFTVGRWGGVGLAVAYVVAYAVVMVGVALSLKSLAVISAQFTRTTLWSGLTFALLLGLNCIPGTSLAGRALIAALAVLLFYFGLTKAARQNIPRLIRGIAAGR